jgi:hypothetical protein
MLRQTLGQLRSRRGLFVMLLLIFVISGGAVVTAQDVTPVIVNDVAIVDRLSWGAIIAGAILGLVLQFGFNLLGISFGFAGMNPDRENSIGSELQDMTKETLIWMGVSMLVALFAAGWVAGRFAGVPNSTDGLLHGVLVWALVMLVSILLLMTSLGRIMSGMTHLIGRGFNLAGQVARTTAQGAATVAQAGVRGAANVAQATARTTENVAQAAADRVEACPTCRKPMGCRTGRNRLTTRLWQKHSRCYGKPDSPPNSLNMNLKWRKIRFSRAYSASPSVQIRQKRCCKKP